MTDERNSNVLRTTLQILLPVVVLAAGAGLGWLIWISKPEAEPEDRAILPPRVRVERAELGDHSVVVSSQGNVGARARIDLVPEVTGKVVEISPNLVAGGSFEQGEVLLRIDPTDYELAVVRQQAEVERAEYLLTQERAEAEIARREWEALGSDEPADPLVLREPQLARAEAEAGAARAALRQAEINLERTVLRAPFAGRVLDESVDIGQYVVAGSRLGTIYSTGDFEVRLPIDDVSVGFLPDDLDTGAVEPHVRLSARLGGRERVWHGRIVRSAGEVDRRTRLVTLIARVPPQSQREILELRVARTASGRANESELAEPIERALLTVDNIAEVDTESTEEGVRIRVEPRTADADRTFVDAVVTAVAGAYSREIAPEPESWLTRSPGAPPPALGQFVRAAIEGVRLEGVVPIPASALVGKDRVLVVERDDEGRDRLFRREVEIARREQGVAYLRAGLEPGERYVTSRLDVVVDGMVVRTAEAGVPGGADAESDEDPDAAGARDARAAGDAATGSGSPPTPPAAPATESKR